MNRLLSRLSTTSLAVALAGPLAAYSSVAAPIVGFLALGVALLLALVTLVLGLVALLRAPAGGRGATARTLVPALIVIVMVVIAGSRGNRYPRINDITTDAVHPPEFVRAVTLAVNAGRDLSYPGERFAAQQRAGYGDIAPLASSLAPAEVYERARATAATMGDWTITRDDPIARVLEGVATSRVFRFQDDFVIEVRPDGHGSVVHMRSKSRVGRGDQGANAARIRRFFAALAPQLAS
jgi:uncharacterized protein (DUF1499 family)